MKKIVAFFLAAALLVLPACSSVPPAASGEGSSPQSSNGEAGAPEESVLVYGSGGYTSINPALYEHGEINSLIFSGLTAHDADNKIVPALAKSWEYDEASDTYTFRLRDDVKWHDGEPFTSEDVKFTLETIMNPDNASEIASNYEDITAIGTPDPQTVTISLKSPNVALLDYLCVGMLPKHALEGKDIATDEFNRKPIGTGPYSLSSWDIGQSITLVKNPDYFEGEPKIDKIIFKIVEDTKARAMQLKTGELDLAQITPHDMGQFENDPEFTVLPMKTADYRGILYNFNNPLFRDHRELPNALSYAVDRQAIIDSVLLGHGQAAYSPLQAGPYNDPDMPKFSYDPSRTKEELEKAGWTLGSDGIYEKGGTKLSFTINCSEGDQVRVDMAAICSQQLKEVGVDAKVAVSPEIDWGGQEAYLIGWGSPFDPDDHTYKVFGTDKGSNFSAYSNAKVDELLQKARETDNGEERKEYYREFQEELAKDLPYTFLAYVDAVYVSRNGLQGITENKVLGHHGVGIFWNVAEWSMN